MHLIIFLFLKNISENKDTKCGNDNKAGFQNMHINNHLFSAKIGFNFENFS
jgi:hypothetical protein